MLSANDVAKYFLSLIDEEDNDLSNLKLQKLLYYAQGFYLAVFDKPLFSEPIERWIHGPVVPSVFHAYKDNANKPIPFNHDLDLNLFDAETKDLLDEVYKVYGQFSASGLRNLTHDEPPWQETETSQAISHESMKNFFKTRLINAQES